MSEPLVTVVIPSYDKAAYVEAALESVRMQTFRDFELIVVDDCSHDGSVRVIEHWLERTGFSCRFIQHARNIGVSRTLNEALALARGPYWAGLGSDDLWHRDFLGERVTRMEGLASGVAVLFGDAEVIDAEGRVIMPSFLELHGQPCPPPEGAVFASLWRGNYIPAMTVLARVDCLRAVGGFDESLHVEDWDLWLRLAERYAFSFSPKPLAQYRYLADSAVHSSAFASRVKDSTTATRLKALGRHDPSRGEVQDLLYWPGGADLLYAEGHLVARCFAMEEWRRDHRLRSLVMLAFLRCRLPYSFFDGFCRLAKSATGLLRRFFRHQTEASRLRGGAGA